MQIKSKVEFEVEVTDPEVAKIAERLVTKYTGNALVRAGTDKKEAWIVTYTTDEDQFQRFLHNEFLKLIPDLEVVKDGDVNTLSWPTKLTEVVLKTIETLDAMPTV